MTELDWQDLFVDCGAALESIAPQLTVAQQSTTVPGTPEWTVTEVYAHLAGVGTSVVTGAMEGAPGAQWTAQHVSSRRGQTLTDLVAEIRTCEPAVAEIIAGAHRPAIVWDRAVHLSDIAEALGMPRLPARLWEPVLTSMAEKAFRELPVTVRAGAHTFGAGGADVEVEPYELYRCLFSRRSSAQVHALLGDSLSQEQRDGIQLFGPREDDQPRPSA
jgi:hypothetical protein